MASIQAPYTTFTDLGGDPLDQGYIYIGLVNQNPETSPKAVFWDLARTIPASQPLRTLGGYIVRNGSPARVYTDGDYSITVRNRGAALVSTSPNGTTISADQISADDGASGALWSTVQGFINYILSSVGSSVVRFIQAGTGAVSQTLQALLRERISVSNFGGVPGGDLYDAWSKAIAASVVAGGKDIYIPPGDYTLSQMPVYGDTVPIVTCGAGRKTKITKAFNGDMVTLGKGCTLEKLYLEGAGATYTGRGVIITTGTATEEQASRYIRDVFILGTKGPGIEFTAALAGFGSVISGGQCIPFDVTTPAVKISGSSETNGNRVLTGGFYTGSNPIIDFGDSENTQVVGCQGGVPQFSTTGRKATIVGSRLVSTTGWTIDGNSTTMAGNTITVMGAPVVFSSTLVNAAIDDSNMWSVGTTFTDNAPGVTASNRIYWPWKLNTPVTNATLGNGTSSGSVRRQGLDMVWSAKLVAGSTTALAIGNWTFTLPAAAARESYGGGEYFNATTSLFYEVGARVGSGLSTVTINWGAARVTNASPAAIAAGSEMGISMTYQIL